MMDKNQTLQAHRQQGVASVLFMMLLGMGLAGIVFGAVYHVRGSQSQAQTVHAQTQAQLKAWSGAEALRQYFFQLGATEAAALQANADISFGTLNGVTARLTRVDAASADCSGGTRLQAQLTGSSGGASSLMELVYCAQGAAAKPVPNDDAVHIADDLKLSGNLKILCKKDSEGQDSGRLVVDGNVDGAGSLGGFKELYATGNIKLGGSTDMEHLFSEKNISISGSGHYTSISAMGDVTLSGTVTTPTLIANGKVGLQSNDLGDVFAIGDVSLRQTKLDRLATAGNVSAEGATIRIKAEVQGNYTAAGGGSVGSGTLGGALSKPNWVDTIHMNQVPGFKVKLQPLTAKTVSKPQVDVTPYRSVANYVFERDGSHTRVTVHKVSGIPDATYYLAGSGSQQDWLCTSSSYSPASCKARICKGHSDTESCFGYSGSTWSVQGRNMAPGVVWFEGSLVAGQGNYINTFLATGNISTAANHSTKSLNYAGHESYASVCASSDFPGLAPLDYCQADTVTFKKQFLGNIAFAAGAKEGSTYTGGKITLAASNHVYGDVLAGDLLETSGSTTVAGYIVAARMGTHSGSNSLGASTTIDLCGADQWRENNPGSGGSGNTSSRLLWSRYR